MKSWPQDEQKINTYCLKNMMRLPKTEFQPPQI